MTPQRVGAPQTIMLARPGGQQANVVTMPAGMARPQTTVNSMVISQAGAGGIRVQGPGLGTRPTGIAAQIPPGAGQSIVINQPGLRPVSVPMQALQNLKPGQGIPTGQAGHLLVKTESGQYQIVKVGTSLPSTMMTMSAGVSTSGPGLPTQPLPPNSMSVRPIMSSSSISNSISLPQRPIGPTTMSVAPTTATTVVTRPPMSTAGQANATGATGGGGGAVGTQMTPDTAKMKCKNFLGTLLRLAGEQPPGVAANVRNLIQGLINGYVEPEVFTTKLQKELNSSPQPCLVPFLKKSLPYLQQSLLSGELAIEGVRPPPVNSPAYRMLQQMPQQQQQQQMKVQVISGSPGNITLSQRPPASVLMSSASPMRPSLATGSPTIVRGQTMVTGSPSMSNSAVAAAISQLRPTGMPPTNIRSISTPLPKSAVPSARIGYGTIQHPTTVTSASGIMVKTMGMPTNLTSATSFSTFSASAMPQPMKPSMVPTPIGKEKKTLAVGGGSSYSSTGDEDIIDVATMGGVDVNEESRRMQGATDMNIGTQIRSCKDETFLQTGRLQHRIARICRERGLAEPPAEVIALVSHATQERLKTLLEKLDVMAEHRLDIIKTEGEGDYEVTQDVRGQIRFLGELDKIERKRHEEAERELLLRAAKSRTKTEDPEKEKLKAKAKELQRIEEEQQRHEKANTTALMAIGMPRKKMRLDDSTASPYASSSSGLGLGGLKSSSMVGRPRVKRVHLRDLLFLMEQERDLKRSPMLWKAYSSSS